MCYIYHFLNALVKLIFIIAMIVDDEVDWEEINPSGWKKSLIYNTFYSIEMAKKTVWDSW